MVLVDTKHSLHGLDGMNPPLHLGDELGVRGAKLLRTWILPLMAGGLPAEHEFVDEVVVGNLHCPILPPIPAELLAHVPLSFHTPCNLHSEACQRRCTVRTETLSISAASA